MTDGIILGFISWLSLILSWWHFPEAIKRFSLRHPVLTDFLASLLSFTLLSGISHSLVAVIGSIVSGLLINFSIMGYNLFNKVEHAKT